jgi:hypothetical protein
MDVQDVERQVDEDRQRESLRRQKEQRILDRLDEIRGTLTNLYKKHNPEKVIEVDALMVKYAGMEEELLKKVRIKYTTKKDKYTTKKDSTKPWSYVLKNYQHPGSGRDREKIQRHNWKVDESIKRIRKVLDEMAGSIGGRCVQAVSKYGQRQFKIQQIDDTGQDEDRIQRSVDRMRSMIHERYRGNDQAPNLSNEHDRRKAEKASKQRQGGRKDSSGTKAFRVVDTRRRKNCK